MAALTKQQYHEIDGIIAELDRGINYIKSARTGIVIINNHPATTTQDFTSQDGKNSLTLVEKSYGSDLCGLYDALRDLKEFRENYRRKLR